MKNNILDSGIKTHEFIRKLFEKAGVKAVACLAKMPGTPPNVNIAYSLLSSSADIENCMPFYPIMAANAATAVSRLTREEAPTAKIAVFLRPCELRAVTELTKIKQINQDNIILISFDCGGVFPLNTKTENNDTKFEAYKEDLKKGNNNPDIRSVCSGCSSFTPECADITISLIGRSMDQTLGICFCSDKGEEVKTALELSETKTIPEASVIKNLSAQRKQAQEILNSQITESLSSTNGLVNIFDDCIACHACRYVCPVCYCKNCYFDSQTFEYQPESYIAKMKSNGATRLPTDRILFHLGRLSHMSTSCVACGMCEDICPMDIPVAQIFKTAGKNTQELFNYMPGHNPEEPFPLVTYKEEELTEMED